MNHLKPPLDDEVNEEIAFHIAMRTRELVERGLTEDAARRDAEARFGNLERVRARCRALGEGRDRQMRRMEFLGELGQDLAFTLRQMLKNPTLTAVAVLTLALGIGGTTGIFGTVYAVVLRPLPLADPTQLMVVGEMFQGSPSAMSAGNYVDVTRSVTGWEGLAAQNFANFNLSEGAGPERVVGAPVTANFFDVMGSRPVLGRVFGPDEDQPGKENVVVLSHRLWTRRFGSSTSIVGRNIRMNSTTFTVLGVMPASFDLTTTSEELWVPIAFTPERKAMHDEHYLMIYGRLKAGVTRQQAQAELDAVAKRLRQQYPMDDGQLNFGLIPFHEQLVGDYRLRLFVLLAAVAIVLIIACGNVANLLLAQGAARRREIAIRVAIGAGHWRIVRQLLTESVALALVAVGVGLVLAKWGIAALVAWGPTDVPRLEQAGVEPIVLGFAIAIALASCAIFGLAPALRLSRTNPQSGLHAGPRGATSGGLRDRLRSSLVAAEVALSLLLLFSAGLLIRSAIALQHVDPGFEPAGLLSARVALPKEIYTEPERVRRTFETMAGAVTGVHGVTHAAISSYAAMGPGGGTNGLLAEGKPVSLDNLVQSLLRIVTPDFFATMRVPIVKGRAFDERDRRGGQLVMIVSQTLAARAFPGQDPIGKRIGCCEEGPNHAQIWKVIVGVAGDVRSHGPAVPPEPEFYLPIAQAPDEAWNWTGQSMYILARSDGDPLALVEPIRASIARIDPDLPVFDVRLMDQRLSSVLATARFNTLLLTILGVVGLLLAATGIYGVIAYLVSQRTSEIGVRIALGATPGAVVRLIVGDAFKPVALGAVVGLAGAIAASRLLTSQLFGVSRTDPVTIVGVVGALLFVALGATIGPARRAATVDPSKALQAE